MTPLPDIPWGKIINMAIITITIIGFLILIIMVFYYWLFAGPKKAREDLCYHYCNNPGLLIAFNGAATLLLVGVFFAVLFGNPQPQYTLGIATIGILLTSLSIIYTTCPYYCPRNKQNQNTIETSRETATESSQINNDQGD